MLCPTLGTYGDQISNLDIIVIGKYLLTIIPLLFPFCYIVFSSL